MVCKDGYHIRTMEGSPTRSSSDGRRGLAMALHAVPGFGLEGKNRDRHDKFSRPFPVPKKLEQLVKVVVPIPVSQMVVQLVDVPSDPVLLPKPQRKRKRKSLRRTKILLRRRVPPKKLFL